MSRFDKTIPELDAADWTAIVAGGIGLGLFAYALGSIATVGFVMFMWAIR